MRLHEKIREGMIFLFVAFWLSGCSPITENNLIEEISPITFLSISKADEGKLKVSTIFPPLSKEDKIVISHEVDLLKEGIQKYNFNFYQEVKSGQMRMLVISEELGQEGIMSIVNTLLTDPDISPRIYLVIMRGNFEEFLESQLDNAENFDYSFYRMLKHYEDRNQGELTVVNLHQFKNLLYTPYSDPFLPIYSIQGDGVNYEGTALFQNDKLVETISSIDDRIFQLINNNHYLAVLPIREFEIVLGHVRSKIDVNIDSSNSTIFFTVSIDSKIEEYRGEKQLFDPQELENLKADIETYLEQQTYEFLKKMQELKVDPLQLGIQTKRPFSKPMEEEEWIDMFEKMYMNVKYNVNIDPLTDANSRRPNF
ncbi:Ger(x)C family spore germination protein [Paenalkalicoccus suaedae]|uniref:Ger(X)C family spore germination protein n=1 Tax=Paenalkalicoccus suaedae TaxID=2592382 RepID=A0A859FC13_9BACI|nr:Ger(x)C family spore germination protein [Paenalkalicoccus suaedae]QKS70281.1 Ger(x)C family spore germination protein [Paenalkalicoccus suaedae]